LRLRKLYGNLTPAILKFVPAFRASIDDYLDWCHKDGMEPESPYSGRFNVRLSPDVRRKISINGDL
jgi:predicted HicB family RNase H-like nuclease